MRPVIVLFFCVFNISFRSVAQKFTTAEIDSVQWKIYDYLQTHQKEAYDSVPSEVIFVILKTNDKSRIASIHLLGDEKNKGVAYSILNQMTINDFKGWNPQNYSDRTIIVPVYSSGIRSNSNYADKAFWDMSWSGETGYIVNKDQKYSVMLSGIMYNPPPKIKADQIILR